MKEPQRVPFSSLREMIQEHRLMESAAPAFAPDYAFVYRVNALAVFLRLADNLVACYDGTCRTLQSRRPY